MTEHDKSQQARKGLVDSVKGKVKEVAGAVSGNDSLTAEGQLEQTQARDRKEANTVEAVADAEAEQARAEATEARVEGAKERIAVSSRTAAVENTVEAQQDAQKRAAEQSAYLDATRDKSRAEADAQREVAQAEARERLDAEAATEDAVDALDEHRAAAQQADGAHTAAERLRERADNLTDQADLP
jgi:uncharacterized protein YjbJ (UPF0337 family)